MEMVKADVGNHTDSAGPLRGMRVLSFCHYLQGPAAMQYLGDMGADIIKIEPPKGAFERHWAGADRASVGGVSALFLCGNRNVRSLAIDLKHAGSRDVIFRLIDSAHVLAENFRPSTLGRLGFGYQAVASRKPDIIYASASGFGSSGPFAARPGQDLLLQAMSGLATVGGVDDRPIPVGCTAVDQHGAALFAMAICGAYCKWLTTGKGTHVEATLLGAAIDLQTESIVTYFARNDGRRALERSSNLATWFHEAPYGIYRIVDCYIALSLNNLGTLGDALGSPKIKGFAAGNAYRDRDAIAAAVAQELAGRTFADIAPDFERHGIWFTRVDDYDDLVQNPQVLHNLNLFKVPVNGRAATLVNHPVRYDGEVSAFRGFALTPGEHSRSILGEAGFSNQEIQDLIRNKIVFAPTDGAEAGEVSS